MPKLWSYAVGEYGYRVQVRERYPGSNLYLFRWDGERRNWRKTSLRHRDKEQAKHEARVAASRRLADAEDVRSGATSLGAAIRLFLFHEGQDFSPQRYKEMEAWRDLWVAHLGPRKPIGQIDRSDLKGYLRDRQRGVIKPPGRDLKKSVSGSRLQKEIAFIKRLLTWASGTKIDGNYLVDRNPVADFVAPPYKARMRPLMTYDRYLIVREWATQADPTGRFPLLLTILEGTGFRVTAACSIEVRDVDLTCTARAPFGQICRRQAYDKMSHQDTWVAISGDVREALVALLKMSQGVGRYPLFPSVRAHKSNGTPKPWTRHYAAKLLRRTQKLAVEAGKLGEEKLERGEFHPFRRKWATERKGHSDVDVAKAGGWGDVRSLKIYQQSDDEGVLAAVLETRKIMEKDA